MKYFFYFLSCILLCLGCQNLFQKAASSVKQQGNVNSQVDSFYDKFKQRYKLVIGYYSYNASTEMRPERRFVIGVNNESSGMQYSYFTPAVQMLNSPRREKCDSVKLSKETITTLLTEFHNTSGWDLNYNDLETPDSYCPYINNVPCFVLHGLTYRVDFIYENFAAASNLYAPERYEKECCSGNINRKKIIAIKVIFDKELKQK